MIPLEELTLLRRRAEANLINPNKPRIQVDPAHLITLILVYEKMFHSPVEPIGFGDLELEPASSDSSLLPSLDKLFNGYFVAQTERTLAVGTAILETQWNFEDPLGRMGKTPEQVEDFLQGTVHETMTWPDFMDKYPTRAKLLSLIAESYRRSYLHEQRALKAQKNPDKPVK
jgi:hypothetical protein